MSAKDLDRIGIVGVGLLGGSIGLAVQAADVPAVRVGIGRRMRSLRSAKAFDAVDEITLDMAKGVAGAGLVIVATPIGRVQQMFKALANPHRLRIFIGLARCCRRGQACAPSMRACVGDLGAGLALSPSTVSHHLKELRRAGLIHMKRAGQHVECWADPEALERLGEFFRFAGGEAPTPAFAERQRKAMGEQR